MRNRSLLTFYRLHLECSDGHYKSFALCSNMRYDYPVHYFLICSLWHGQFVFISCFYLMKIEGSVVHIMKALASHSSAAPSLVEDDALQLLFHMVANGSVSVFSQFREGLVPLHTIQLHRHAMQASWYDATLSSIVPIRSHVTKSKCTKFTTKQVLGLLLANDNGTSAKYIRKHHLVLSLSLHCEWKHSSFVVLSLGISSYLLGKMVHWNQTPYNMVSSVI